MTRYGLLATFMIAVGIIAWDELKRQRRVPHPERFVHAAIVWAILGLAADLGARELATVFGVGLVLSMAYIYYNGTTTDNKTAEQTVRGGMSGGVDLNATGRIAGANQ